MYPVIPGTRRRIVSYPAIWIMPDNDLDTRDSAFARQLVYVPIPGPVTISESLPQASCALQRRRSRVLISHPYHIAHQEPVSCFEWHLHCWLYR